MKLIILLGICALVSVLDASLRTDEKLELLKKIIQRELGNDSERRGGPGSNSPAKGNSAEGDSDSDDDEDCTEMTEELIAIIREQDQKYMDYFTQQDYVSLGNLYTDDACYYAPTMPPVCGNEEIKSKVWDPAEAGEPGMAILYFHADHLTRTGCQYVIGHGGWHVSIREEPDEAPFPVAEGNFLSVHKKVNGKWKIQVDIINEGFAAEDSSAGQTTVEREVRQLYAGALKRRLVENGVSQGLKDRLGVRG